MKKKFIKMLCSVAIGCMISTSYISKVSATPTNKTKIDYNEINISEDSSKSERIPSTNSKPLGLNANKS